MVSLSVLSGGRVRKPRAVEDQSAPIPQEIASKGVWLLLEQKGKGFNDRRLYQMPHVRQRQN